MRKLTAGGLAICGRHHRRKNAPIWQDTEESLPAGVAAVGRKPQKAFQEDQSALLHAIPRNVLEIEVSAPRAVGIPRERERHEPGVESPVARVASPGPQSDRGAQEIEYPAAVRTITISTPALRADHRIDSTPRDGAPEYPKLLAGATIAIIMAIIA